MFRTQRKAVEAGAHGTLEYTIKEGENKDRLADEKIIKSKILKRNKKKPFALIAKTIKGNPISFMKNVPLWHYRSPNKKEFNHALRQIKKYEKRI